MRKILFAAITLLLALASCDDNTDTLGSSLTNTEDLIQVSDNVFDIVSKTVAADSVISRNTLGYLGLVKDPETGAYVKSDFVTQFHISEGYAFPPEDTLARGITADSCDVRLFFENFYGDSLASMKATLYELRKPVEENAVFYNNFHYRLCILIPGYTIAIIIVVHLSGAGDGKRAGIVQSPCKVIAAGAAFYRVRKCRHRQQREYQAQRKK